MGYQAIIPTLMIVSRLYFVIVELIILQQVEFFVFSIDSMLFSSNNFLSKLIHEVNMSDPYGVDCIVERSFGVYHNRARVLESTGC